MYAKENTHLHFCTSQCVVPTVCSAVLPTEEKQRPIVRFHRLCHSLVQHTENNMVGANVTVCLTCHLTGHTLTCTLSHAYIHVQHTHTHTHTMYTTQALGGDHTHPQPSRQPEQDSSSREAVEEATTNGEQEKTQQATHDL